MFTNKALKDLIVPLVIEQILVMLVGMVDTMMVSHAGEADISGVALVDMIDYLIITIFSTLATGGAVIVSQYLGGRQKEQANTSAGQLITISFFLSVVVMALCLVFHKGILKLLFGKIEADVMEACVTYFVITAFSFPFLGIYNASAALFRSVQKNRCYHARLRADECNQYCWKRHRNFRFQSRRCGSCRADADIKNGCRCTYDGAFIP